MTPEISSLIAACEWFPSNFLIFSDNVFAPLIYYSHLGALIPTLLIGLYVFISKPKSLTNQLLLLTTVAFAIWIFGDLVLWATEYPSYTMFFWSMLVLVEPFVYFFAMYFAFAFTFKRDLPFWGLVGASLPLLITIVIAPTSLALLGYDISNCDRSAYEGIGASYGYVIEAFYVFLIVCFAVMGALHARDNRTERAKILLLTGGIVLFLISFSLGNILEVFTENWYIGQYGLFGAPIFTGILAYIIIRYQAFNVRLLGAQALVGGLLILILSMLFVRSIENIRIIIILTFALVLLIGMWLIRGVRREVEQRTLAQRLATELAGANAHLERLDKMKSEFVSIASHQLRSPLTSIRGYVSMLLEGTYGQMDPKMKEVLQHVSDAARNMSLSVEDYLNVSRIEAGNMKYELADVDLRKLIEDIVAEMLPVGLKKEIDIRFQPQVEGPVLSKLDPGKTRQIVQNLIDNALKYTEGKGSVMLSLRKDARAKKVYLDVTDTGIGIAPDALDALFSKFERAKNANSVNVTGTGLGLYIARQMARAMEGDITVTSPGEGKGSTFTVVFPLNGIASTWSAK